MKKLLYVCVIVASVFMLPGLAATPQCKAPNGFSFIVGRTVDTATMQYLKLRVQHLVPCDPAHFAKPQCQQWQATVINFPCSIGKNVDTCISDLFVTTAKSGAIKSLFCTTAAS